MNKYYPLYKCRVCGTIYGEDGFSISSEELWATCIDAGLHAGNVKPEILSTTPLVLIEMHDCGGGQLGLSDFIGGKRVVA